MDNICRCVNSLSPKNQIGIRSYQVLKVSLAQSTRTIALAAVVRSIIMNQA